MTCAECQARLAANEVVACGHEGFLYCDRICANVACGQCYDEAMEDR